MAQLDLSNIVLFGDEKPTKEALANLYKRAYEKDQFNSHLWRDGPQVCLRVRTPNAGARARYVTQRGCLVYSFGHFAPP